MQFVVKTSQTPIHPNNPCTQEPDNKLSISSAEPSPHHLLPPPIPLLAASPMASLLLRPSALVVGLSFSSVLLAPLALRPRPLLLRCDASPEPLAGREWSYTRDARTPVRSQGRWNPQALKQVSAGSILGTLFRRTAGKYRGFSDWKERVGGLSDIRTQANG